ncbi:MAG: outer membrane beta-barrel protein, partial [Pseudorhodoplanes sp.]
MQSPTGSPGAPSAWNAWEPAAPGFQAGGFTVHPSVTGGAFHDDNVFATNSNRKSDWAGFVRPELQLRSVGQQHAFQVQGAVESRWYDRYKSEDQTNVAVAAGGLYMPDPDTQLIGKFAYNPAHESRGSGESELFGFDRPLAYDTYEAAAAINKRFGRWWTSLGA